MMNWTKCEADNGFAGDLISWPDVNNIPDHVSVTNQTLDTFCKDTEIQGLYIIPVKLEFDVGVMACQQIKSNIFTYTDTVETFVTEHLPEERDGFWIGYVKDPVTGDFTAKYGDKGNISATKLVWGKGEPNGGFNEACSELSGNC